jgi:hypothetical protein
MTNQTQQNLEDVIRVESKVSMEFAPLNDTDYSGYLKFLQYGFQLDFRVGLKANFDRIVEAFGKDLKSGYDLFKVELSDEKGQALEVNDSLREFIVKVVGRDIWSLGYSPELFDEQGRRVTHRGEGGYTSQQHIEFGANAIGCSVGMGYVRTFSVTREQFTTDDIRELNGLIEKYSGERK